MAAARARPVVLRHARAVLAMTSGLDTSVPNMARVYNYWLGGKDHFAADRAEAERLVELYPPLPVLARENRAFLLEAAGWAARQGIGQFHRPGRRASGVSVGPPSRAGGPARSPGRLCRHRPGGADPCRGATGYRRWCGVWGNQDLRAVINPGQPVCVILGAVLHFLDPDAACAVTAGYVSLLAPGSCLVLSCARFEDEELAKQLAEEYTAATWYNHSPADIVSFFGGLELAGPGVTEARTWPKRAPEADDRNGHVLAGVGRVLGM